MSTKNIIKKTVLYNQHQKLGAKMSPFGGFDMPIQYSGIINEHMATRTGATLFDTCHMGEFTFVGPNALSDLENLLTCPVESMETGQCRYGFICNEAGGVIDDQIIYRIADDEFFMVVNASTQENDFKWITSHLSENTKANNITDITAKIDLQGPKSPKIMAQLVNEPIDGMKYYRFRYNTFENTEVLVSRTGYTGEIGFEIYCPNELADKIWEKCLSIGAVPAGLGARDTLRLEMGMPLYGHEINEKTNPTATGFTKSISKNKKFIGSEIVNNVESDKLLVGIQLEGKRAGRANDVVLNSNEENIGIVTSGSFAPSINKAIAMGYVDKKYATVDTRVLLDNGRKKIEGVIVELPFYKNATGRKALKNFL